MKTHLTLAHNTWEKYIQPGDTVIDATAGNGNDTFFLAQLLKGEGKLIGYDIQAEALAQTQKRLADLPAHWREIVELRLQSHVQFSENKVKLIVYNLGYLPGGNKMITTKTESTLLSLQSALHSLAKKGSISITCYPGHPAGVLEQKAIMEFLKTLPSDKWNICHHVWLNRPVSPTWIWLQDAHGA